MTKAVIVGFVFHRGHDVLMEFCWNYATRVTEIKRNKPKNERKLRLRLLQIIPEHRLPPALVRARVAFNKAYEALVDYDKARVAYREARDACTPEIEKLHQELCLNCPWDGQTIFSRKDKDGNWY